MDLQVKTIGKIEAVFSICLFLVNSKEESPYLI